MYLAEIHGKLSRDNENKEDILTSNVFSFLKYAPRNIFLLEFAQMLGLDVSASDALGAEFRFWPKFEDHTEPDLVLLIGKYYLLIEAKYHSGFGVEIGEKKHQIVREILGGTYEAHNLDKEFRIIAVTAHYSEKSKIASDIPAEYAGRLLWVNWQSIALMIYEQTENTPRLSVEARLFANDLYELLVSKGLRNFAGTRVLSDLPHLSITTQASLFFDARTASYRGAFVGFENSLPDLNIADAFGSLFWNSK